MLTSEFNLEVAQRVWKEEGIEEGIEIGRKEGMEKGRKEGMEKGRKEGMEKGRKEGMEKGRKEGMEKGRKEGINNTIKVLKRFSVQNDEIINEICNLYGLSEYDAKKYILD